MKESTDLRGLKSMAISLLYTDIHKTDFSPLVVTHPFTNSGIVPVLKDGERKLLDITQSEEDEQLWRSGLAKEIREAQTPVQIFTMINKPYLLTFMKLAEPYLSRKDFSGMFGEAWITSEAPHQDVNVSKEESVTFFKQYDAEVLMEEDTFFAAMEIENPRDVKGLINLTFNLPHYTLIQDLKDMEKIGRFHMMNTSVVTADNAEGRDYAQIGRDLLASGKGIFTNHGLLFKNEEIPFTEVYDGQVFPQYTYKESYLLSVRVGFGELSEYLYLPEEENAITKAFNRLGASPDEIRLFEDEKHGIEVQIASDIEFGQHLCRLFCENNTLADVNTATWLVKHADGSFASDLENDVIYDQYRHANELIADIRKRTEEAGFVIYANCQYTKKTESNLRLFYLLMFFTFFQIIYPKKMPQSVH